MTAPTDPRGVARRALRLLDLTTLNDNDTEAVVAALCARAITPFGSVAAVCVYPRFAACAKRALGRSGVRVAAVANFPLGEADARKAAADTRAAIDAGADEIDIVMPYRAVIAGDLAAARDLIVASREAAGPRITLKVILETGALKAPELMAAASRLAIDAGADFIKTSTGKLQPGATLDAACVMLEAIRAARPRRVGFKAAGGIRTLDQAESYLRVADEILGADWATPATFRFGASSLLDDLLRYLGGATTPACGSTY